MSHKKTEYLRLGIYNKCSPRSLSNTKKPYFKEKELFSKAIEMNLNNNCRIKYSKDVPQYCWRVCRADILKEYKLQAELRTMRENMNKSFETVETKSNKSPTPEKRSTKLNKSICGTTRTNEASPNKPTAPLKLPTVKLRAILSKRTEDTSPSPSQGRNSILLRYFADKKRESKRYTSVERVPKWDLYFNNNRKDYSIANESVFRNEVQCESIESSRYPMKNAGSTTHDLINGTTSHNYVEKTRSILSKGVINPFHRRSTSITRKDQANWNKDYQRIFDRRPNEFHRNGQLCWNEAVCRKSYGSVLRGVYKVKC